MRTSVAAPWISRAASSSFSFRRARGSVYHLYRNDADALCFSLLSPSDHGGDPPNEYLGSYRLEEDDSWTRVDESEV